MAPTLLVLKRSLKHVLEILIKKQDKSFLKKINQAFIQAVLLMSVFEQRLSFRMF